MQAFEYASPKTLAETVKLLSTEWGDSAILAGGTDLLSLMKDEAATPKRLVSLKHVSGLTGVEWSDAGLRIGAMTTVEELMESAAVRQHYPALVEASDGIRSQQVRNMGSVGGELLQRPRCWYYRAGYGLLAMNQGKSLVPEGDNRYHSILGNEGPAYFVSPSSFAPVLIALGAKARLHGPQGSREVSVKDLYLVPKSETEREHSLKPNEILTQISVPNPHGAKMAFYEVRQREGLDWPLAAAAAVLHIDGGIIRSARVVLGHVAPIPWPSPEAEQALQGKSVNEDTATAAGKAAVNQAKPLSKNGYKIRLTEVAVRRAVLQASKA